MISSSQRIQSLPPYPFVEMDRMVNALQQQGIDVIDFGTGDPRDETPECVRKATQEAIETYKASGYPSTQGLPIFQQAIAEWAKKRFGIALDPETEITSTLGSKEAIFNFPQAFLNEGDLVLSPNPGYPAYARGTLFARGTNHLYPLLPSNDFYPDFSSIPAESAERAKILWLCYPNSPTGKCATRELYERAVEFCQKHKIMLASDECYIDLYLSEKAMSVLEVSKKGVVAFHSLSKRNNMTGYRIGFLCGDAEMIQAFKKLKTNVDSGTPNFIQAGAIAALKNEEHVESMRKKYAARRDILLEALRTLNAQVVEPEGTFYIWQRVPKGWDSISFAKRLLEPDGAIAVTPGEWIAQTTEDGMNPGRDHVRFALVESEERIREAAERIKKLKLTSHP